MLGSKENRHVERERVDSHWLSLMIFAAIHTHLLFVWSLSFYDHECACTHLCAGHWTDERILLLLMLLDRIIMMMMFLITTTTNSTITLSDVRSGGEYRFMQKYTLLRYFDEYNYIWFYFIFVSFCCCCSEIIFRNKNKKSEDR